MNHIIKIIHYIFFFVNLTFVFCVVFFDYGFQVVGKKIGMPNGKQQNDQGDHFYDESPLLRSFDSPKLVSRKSSSKQNSLNRNSPRLATFDENEDQNELNSSKESHPDIDAMSVVSLYTSAENLDLQMDVERYLYLIF